MSYWNRKPDFDALRKQAQANLAHIKSGGLDREKREKDEQRKLARRGEELRRERRKQITADLKLLRADLREQRKLYSLIEDDRADIGIRDAAHKQGALEEVDSTIEKLQHKIIKLTEERTALK